MPNLNTCQIMGNLGSEPELRFAPNGNPVISFSVAVNEKYTNTNGEKVENTEWFTVTAWGKLAESCNKFLSKGAPVFVSGKIHLHKWDSDNGERSRLEIKAYKVVFLGRKKEEAPDELAPEDIPF